MGIELNELHQKIGAELKSMRLLAGFSSYEVFANKNNLSKIQYFKMEKGTNFTLKSLIVFLEFMTYQSSIFSINLIKKPKLQPTLNVLKELPCFWTTYNNLSLCLVNLLVSRMLIKLMLF